MIVAVPATWLIMGLSWTVCVLMVCLAADAPVTAVHVSIVRAFPNWGERV